MTISDEDVLRVKSAQAAAAMAPYVDTRMLLNRQQHQERRTGVSTRVPPASAPSEELRVNQIPQPAGALPNLTAMYPSRYSSHPPQGLQEGTIFHAGNAEGLTLMESLIERHRYYERQGVWAPVIDLDKRVTATIIHALGARSCVELGCFSGPVLSVMMDKGIDVCGVEISHTAFLLASDKVHSKIRYGNFADLTFDRQFDAFLGMDILEHLSPLKLDACISQIAKVVSPGGFAYINSPMFGRDRIFGEVFSQYRAEWSAVGDASYWYDIHCDNAGWPMHGHLVWASPVWWEQCFLRHRLVRDTTLEKLVHEMLADFFKNVAHARRSLFVLRHQGAKPPDYRDVEARLRNELGAVLAGEPT